MMNFKEFMYQRFEEESQGHNVDTSCPDAFDSWIENKEYEDVVSYVDTFVNQIRKGLL